MNWLRIPKNLTCQEFFLPVPIDDLLSGWWFIIGTVDCTLKKPCFRIALTDLLFVQKHFHNYKYTKQDYIFQPDSRKAWDPFAICTVCFLSALYPLSVNNANILRWGWDVNFLWKFVCFFAFLKPNISFTLQTWYVVQVWTYSVAGIYHLFWYILMKWWS